MFNHHPNDLPGSLSMQLRNMKKVSLHFNMLGEEVERLFFYIIYTKPSKYPSVTLKWTYLVITEVARVTSILRLKPSLRKSETTDKTRPTQTIPGYAIHAHLYQKFPRKVVFCCSDVNSPQYNANRKVTRPGYDETKIRVL